MSDPRKTIVVGVDGSASSSAAVEQAASLAAARRLPVLLVHAWETYPLYEGALIIDPAEVEAAEAAVLEHAAVRLREIAPGVEQRTSLVQDRADVALLTAAEHAALLVMGCHSGSRAWLGPVLPHVLHRAPCPVLAVPAGAPALSGPVVVGVDGSAMSAEAVGHAFEEASRRGAALTALLSVTPTFDAYVPSDAVLAQLRERGERHLAESLAGWQEKYPDVEVTQVVTLDAALPALRSAAQGAAVLVVGTHGRGAVLRAVLGSVSSSLLRSAPCPVLVVPPTDQGAAHPPATLQPGPVPFF